MRRKGVPGACSAWCAIKERLDKLWNRTIGSIIKINDVTPDGDGSFTIEPGQNVRISETGTGNGIKIDTTGGVTYYTTDDPKLSIDNDDLKISTVDVARQSDLDTVAAAEVLDRNDIDDILDGTKAAARAASATDAINAQYLGNASANVGNDTKPIKIVNGQAVAVADDLALNSEVLHKTGNESKDGFLNILDNGYYATLRNVSKRMRVWPFYINNNYQGFEINFGNDEANNGGLRLFINESTGTITMALTKTTNGTYSEKVIDTF